MPFSRKFVQFFVFLMLFSAAVFAQSAQDAANAPNAPSASQPAPAMDCYADPCTETGARTNFSSFVHQTFSPATIVFPAVGTLFSRAVTEHESFGHGASGWGHRYGVSVADRVNGKFIRAFAMPTVFRQSANYCPAPAGARVGTRIRSAIEHSLVTRTPSGRATFNMSGIPGSFAVAGMGTLYYPDRYTTASETMKRAGYMQLGYLAGDFWNEFKPEACRAMHLRCGKR